MAEAFPGTRILVDANDGYDLDVLLMDVMSFGVTRWRQTMPAVREAGVVASPHAWGRPVKTLYAAQLAAGLGSVEVVEGVPGMTAGVDAATSSPTADSRSPSPRLRASGAGGLTLLSLESGGGGPVEIRAP